MAADSTLDDVRTAEDGPLPRWGRRAGLALMALVVAAGAVGALGVRSRTVHTVSSGYGLTITYPQVARAGLDVPFRVSVHHTGGLPSTLVLAISAAWFRMFETQGFYPTADSMSNDGTWVYFTFQNPPGANFTLEYDAYIQPAQQIGKSATVRVIVDHTTVAQSSITTFLVP